MKAINDWWQKLPQKHKEVVMTKVMGKTIRFPNCTKYWNQLTDEQKKWVACRVEVTSGMKEAHLNGIVKCRWRTGHTFEE